jgi:hypothetical protein
MMFSCVPPAPITHSCGAAFFHGCAHRRASQNKQQLAYHASVESAKSDVCFEASKVLCNMVAETSWHGTLLNLGISNSLIKVRLLTRQL